MQIGRFYKVYHGGLDNDPGKHLEPLVKWMARENLTQGSDQEQVGERENIYSF